MPQDQDDHDDLDDLDDILDDFSALPKPAAPKATPPPQPQPQPQPAQGDPSEADLARQMAALLASLGGPQDGGTDAGGPGPGDDDDDDLTKLLAQIMRGGPGQEDGADGAESGMDDAGFEQLLASLGQRPIPTASGSGSGSGSGSTAPTGSKPPAPAPAPASTDKPLSFEETIKRTMSNLKDSEASSRANANASSAPDPNDPLAQLLASLNIDPSELDLDALAAGGADPSSAGDFSGVLDGMMKQLMTKEILEEPLAELADKYPPYLATHGPALPAAQRAKYTQQNTIVVQILEIFRDPSYSDASDAQRSRVTALMTQMQDLGSPPDEIMGDMPEGLDLGGEGCTIM